jgi:hypothetical protein
MHFLRSAVLCSQKSRCFKFVHGIEHITAISQFLYNGLCLFHCHVLAHPNWFLRRYPVHTATVDDACCWPRAAHEPWIDFCRIPDPVLVGSMSQRAGTAASSRPTCWPVYLSARGTAHWWLPPAPWRRCWTCCCCAMRRG